MRGRASEVCDRGLLEVSPEFLAGLQHQKTAATAWLWPHSGYHWAKVLMEGALFVHEGGQVEHDVFGQAVKFGLEHGLSGLHPPHAQGL